MRLVWDATARDVPYIVARAVRSGRIDPPCWLKAARRCPPAPSLSLRTRFLDDETLSKAAKSDWELAAEAERLKAQAAQPDNSALGWATDQKKCNTVFGHSQNRMSRLRAMTLKARKVPKIWYPEDALRRKFYKKHPFELTKPKLMVEDSGVNVRDWSRLDGGVYGEITGENVIQHQHYLMTVEKKEEKEAYNDILNKFYRLRAREEVAKRVAEEQALHHGAPPRKSLVAHQLAKEEEELKKSYEFMRNQSNFMKVRKMSQERAFTETAE